MHQFYNARLKRLVLIDTMIDFTNHFASITFTYAELPFLRNKVLFKQNLMIQKTIPRR